MLNLWTDPASATAAARDAADRPSKLMTGTRPTAAGSLATSTSCDEPPLALVCSSLTETNGQRLVMLQVPSFVVVVIEVMSIGSLLTLALLKLLWTAALVGLMPPPS